MKKGMLLAALLFMVTLSACGTSNGGAKSSGNKSTGSSQNAGSGGTNSSATGLCGDINAAKTQLNNLKSLGSSPSLDQLTTDLKQMQTKLKAAGSSAPAILKTGFSGVEQADSALQTTIGQVKNSGAPASTYEQPVKQGVAAIGTSFDALVSASKCA